MFFYLTCSENFAILIVIITGNVTERMKFAFMSVWGDYFTSLICLNPEKTLLCVALANYFGGSTGVLAATVLYIMPVVIIFFFAQKYILKGVVTTGLKG